MASTSKQQLEPKLAPIKLPRVYTRHSLPPGTYIISKSKPKEPHHCHQCKIKRRIRYRVKRTNFSRYICTDNCLENFKREHRNCFIKWSRSIKLKNLENLEATTFVRSCCVCQSSEDNNYSITWQSMDFCSELCLLERQAKLCSLCLRCGTTVSLDLLGQCCFRFGSDFRQFCSSTCQLKQWKKFQACTYCLQNIRRTARGSKFCSSSCQENSTASSPKPKVCKTCGIHCSSFIRYDNEDFTEISYFCSDKCFIAFREKYFVDARACCYCEKFVPASYMKKYTVFDAFVLYVFCSSLCRKLYINSNTIIISCDFCNVQKDKFEIIRKYVGAEIKSFCSLKCLGAHQSNAQVLRYTCNNCRLCRTQMFTFPDSDGSSSNFCSLSCLSKFKCGTSSDRDVIKYLQEQCNDNDNTDSVIIVEDSDDND